MATATSEIETGSKSISKGLLHRLRAQLPERRQSSQKDEWSALYFPAETP